MTAGIGSIGPPQPWVQDLNWNESLCKFTIPTCPFWLDRPMATKTWVGLCECANVHSAKRWAGAHHLSDKPSQRFRNRESRECRCRITRCTCGNLQTSKLTLPLPGCVWIPESDTGSGMLWKWWVTDYFQSFPCLLWVGGGVGGGLVLLTKHRSSGSCCQTQRGHRDFPTLLISKHIVWARREPGASIESCVFYPKGRISKY